MSNNIKPVNKSISKWEIKNKKKSLTEAVDASTIGFQNLEQGIEILSFAASIRALGLSNRDLQPRKLSNYIRSGYLQIQIISSIILFQFRGDKGVSRDDLYDSVCDVFPATTFANFRKVLSIGVDSEILIRKKDPDDSRRTLYTLSNDMIEPLTRYFTSTLSDFDRLFNSVFDGALSDNDIKTVENYLKTRMTLVER
tara:strand:+ start:7547 stop:8137 length:591 start_codon:yes stop_codon:yes gene_type:complete